MESFETMKKRYLVLFAIFLVGYTMSAYEKNSLIDAIIIGFLITSAIYGIPVLILMLFLKRYGPIRGWIFGGAVACLVELGWAYLSRALGYEEWGTFVIAAVFGAIAIVLAVGYEISCRPNKNKRES